MKRIAVTGATGLIGRSLVPKLLNEGYRLTIFLRDSSRSPWNGKSIELVEWDVMAGPPPVSALEGHDAVVHLAGFPIAAGRWTTSRKRAIRESRVIGTRNLVEALRSSTSRPPTLLSASAIGFYGNRGTEILTEASPPGTGFLPEVCSQWESEAMAAKELGMRVVLLRTGIVLSTEGGALEKILPPFRLGFGGKLGRGDQYMSWIHLTDLVRLICFSLEIVVDGPLNGTAPHPLTNREFTRVLADVLYRPSFATVPATMLRLMYGEMAQSLLLEGQNVIPEKAVQEGFEFTFPTLQEALTDLLGSGSRP